LSLRERTQKSLKNPKKQAHNLPQVGDVVLIKENLSHGRWKIGVHELIKGKKGFKPSLSYRMSCKYVRIYNLILVKLKIKIDHPMVTITEMM